MMKYKMWRQWMAGRGSPSDSCNEVVVSIVFVILNISDLY